MYVNAAGTVRLYQGDCLEILPMLSEHGLVRLIFADPPYFLSNGGITCHAGRMVSVNKGTWDRLESVDRMHAFNRSWVDTCRSALEKDGSIWVSGTRHVIYSVGFAMQQLEMKLLNEIAWEKPNPPPNLSCRYFTHSTETLIWAAKTTKSRHIFNYQAMRALAGGKQMKSVWRIPAPRAEEKTFGKHPTQKPLALLERIIEACTNPGDLVLDPFVGSGTTGVAAIRLNRRFIGIELDPRFASVAVGRVAEAERQMALVL
jgi:site-specific DNA-methyltransferase (adenine-specific)